MFCYCISCGFVLAMPPSCRVVTAMERMFQQQLLGWLSPPSPPAPQPHPLTVTYLPNPPSPPSHRTPSPIPLVPHALSPPTPPSQLPSPPPPSKFAPAHVPTPPLALGSDPLTPRTEQLLRLPLRELDSRFDMGWSHYVLALRPYGQVQMWHRGQRLGRSHFLNRSLERARLIARATQAPKPRTSLLLVQPATCHLAAPHGQPTLPDMVQHRRVSLLPMRPTTAPPPPPPPSPPPTRRVRFSKRTSEGSVTLAQMQRRELRPFTPPGRFSNRGRPYPRRGFPPPPPPHQPSSKETAEQCNARTSGAPRFAVCSCTMSDAGPDCSASNKSQTFMFEYMGHVPCEPGEYQSPCGPQANAPRAAENAARD